MPETTEGPRTALPQAAGPSAPRGAGGAAGDPSGAQRAIPAAAYDLMTQARRHGWYYRTVWAKPNPDGTQFMRLDIGRLFAPGEADRFPDSRRDGWIYQLVWSVARPGQGHRSRSFLVPTKCRAWTPANRKATTAPSLAQLAKVMAENPAPAPATGDRR